MTQLDVTLAARAHRDGRAYRTSALLHRRLLDTQLALVLWQLGAEPFSAAAIGYGEEPDDLKLVVAGEPRNRDLAFAALAEFACWFNPRFEAAAQERETVQRGTQTRERAPTIPQLLVANRGTVELLGRLGRRLAYLPLDGDNPAPPELVRLGIHLVFVGRHATEPGQQLIISLTDILNAHWATPLSDLERMSLSALDAYIEPPHGMHGFNAAAVAEREPVGPTADGDDEARLEPLVEEFNATRAGSTDPAVVAPLFAPLEGHYRPHVERTWELLWRCRDREAAWPEAASAERRFQEDRDAYTRHMDWLVEGGGRRRTRQTPRQAAMTMRRLESVKAQLLAEEACDDAVRMIPYLLDNKAVEGDVVRIDRDYKEIANVKMATRPLLTLASPDPCLIPIGRTLWWAENPGGPGWVVHEVTGASSGGSTVTLKLTTGSTSAETPEVGETACFSVLKTKSHWPQRLPYDAPWTHEPEIEPDLPTVIEAEGEEAA